MSSTLPLITECKGGNCVFHFPQFERFDLLAATEYLALIKKYRKECPISDEIVAAYEAALMDNNVIRCAELVDSRGCEYFLDLRGGVAKFIPCCR